MNRDGFASEDPADLAWRCADEQPSIHRLREWAEGHLGPSAHLLDDDEIVHRWRAHAPRKPRHWRYNTGVLARGHSAALSEAVPLQSLAEPRRIGFVVLDGLGKPFGKLAFVLNHGNRVLERGALGNDATVRRSDVIDDDYTLQLVDVDAVTWGDTRACLDQPTMLHVRTSGLDGQTLEVRVFEEFRERDDDVLANGEITVNGGVGVLAWTPKAADFPADPTRGGSVSLVAEVRDGDGHWAKTDVPLALELPALAALSWSTPSSPRGTAVDLVAVTRGFADGTSVDFDVWRVDWSGDDVHVCTLEPATIAAGRASATWMPESPGEYWFSASVSAAEVHTAASGLRIAT